MQQTGKLCDEAVELSMATYASSSILVDIEPVGQRVTIRHGATLLEAIQKAGLNITASCGGSGFCGNCLVRIMGGAVSPVSVNETIFLESNQLTDGYRLACQTVPLGDTKIYIPPISLAMGQQLQVEGQERALELHPAISIAEIVPSEILSSWDSIFISPPFDHCKLGDRQKEMLKETIRRNDGRVRLITKGTDLIAGLSQGARVLGLAMDIGSTKVAFYLVDLESGKTLAMTGILNPQIAFGEDIISRIAYAEKGAEQSKELQSKLIHEINNTVAALCEKVGAQPGQICDCILVGNTVIHHLVFGLPVSQLGRAPYLPATKESFSISASKLGLSLAPGAQIFSPPLIAGYIGTDHVAALTAALFPDPDQTRILIDIGTNTEISLSHAGRFYSCSCASGPAFEGAYIRDGMRALPGAIESIQIRPDGELTVRTIGNKPPIGICGSGILSTVSELLRAGIIDRRGVIRWGEKKEFTLVNAEASGQNRDILVTRKDIHEIQLAKGAIRAGIEVLLKHAGIDASQITEWIIAGAFGTKIDLRAAMTIGMFPEQPLERFHQVGNAAGMGAKKLLLSEPERQRLNEFLCNIEYVELTTEPGFEEIYVQALYLPE